MRVERHPIGFYKVTLLSVMGYKLRLHYWSKSSDYHRDIHTHRWSFVSFPLIGSFIETKYKENNLKSHELNECKRLDSKMTVKTVGRGGVRKESFKVRKPFRPYFCMQGDIHSLIPVAGKTGLTLVLTSKPKEVQSLVWRKV